MISGFVREMGENCALLCYYTASSGNFLTTSGDNLLVPTSNVKKMAPIICPEMSTKNYHAHNCAGLNRLKFK